MHKGQQLPWLVSDDLWGEIQPLLPRHAPRASRVGRKRLPDRRVLCGILFVLHTGIQWEHLPQELGFGSGMTCWRRLAEWNEAGVWSGLHQILLAGLPTSRKFDWERAVVNPSSAQTTRRASQAARSRATPAGRDRTTRSRA